MRSYFVDKAGDVQESHFEAKNSGLVVAVSGFGHGPVEGQNDPVVFAASDTAIPVVLAVKLPLVGGFAD